MEKIIGTKFMHKGIQIKLTSLLDDYSPSQKFAYFYTDIPDVICIVGENIEINSDKRIVYSFSKQIQDFCCKYDQGAIRKYDEHGQFYQQGGKFAYVLYGNMKTEGNVHKIGKWFSHAQILDLAEFLGKTIQILKQKQFYFGGYRPAHIFLRNNKFQMIGGELSSKQQDTHTYVSRMNKVIRFNDHYIEYQAPQLFNTKKSSQLNYKSDLFVAGCIIYQLLFGQYPFSTQQNLQNGIIQYSQQSNDSGLIKFLLNKILIVNPSMRAQPEQLLDLIQIERTNVMFMSQKNINNLLLQNSDQESSISILQNISDFFVKCTKQTEGWILHYCQNSSYAPDQKYIDLIIKKIIRKQDKVQKLITTMERISQNVVFVNKSIQNNQSGLYSKSPPSSKSLNSSINQPNIWVSLKIGMALLTIFQKSSKKSLYIFLDPFQKIMNKILQKNPNNQLLKILCKIIIIKAMFHNKILMFSGNFYLKPTNFVQMNMASIQFLSQYSLKLVSYIGKFTHQTEQQLLLPVQKKCMEMLCDQLYNTTTMLIYCLMALRKDISLQLRQDKQFEQLQNKTIQNIKKLLSQIQMLSQQSQQISSHGLYSILADFYSYQQQLYLIYEPVLTSYQYFYLDKQQYKGLKLPYNYSIVYETQNNNIKYQQQEQQNMFRNRVPLKQRIQTMKTKSNQQNIKQKAKTNNYYDNKNKLQNQFNNEVMKSEGSKLSNPSKTVNDLQKNGKHSQFQQFGNFQVSIKCISTQQVNTIQNKKDKTNNNKVPKSNVECAKSQSSESTNKPQKSIEQFDFLNSDINSYEWLKRTQNVVKYMFKKPELDANIHFLFEQISKGLKLKELIQAIDKDKRIIIDPAHILFQKVIGSGSAGQVYIGKYREKVVAIKKVKLVSNPGALKQFQREVLTYIKIKKHPNLVSMIGLTKYNQDYFLITEFCQGGSLFDILHKQIDTIQLSWQQRYKLIIQMARGMKVLHDMNPPVIHRDLKSLNVFISKVDGQWTSKVADFGLSRSPDANLMTSALGTLHWMAPELLSNKQYSIKVDVYSFAVVTWEICCRKTPYHTFKNPMEIVRHVIVEKGRPMLQLINQGCPPQLVNLIKQCWDQCPDKRPFFDQIIDSLQKIKV